MTRDDVSTAGARTRRPVLGLTLGDPAGIGPELWVRILTAAHASGELAAMPRLRLYGDGGVLERAAADLHLLAAWEACRTALDLVEVTRLLPDDVRPGRPGAAGGAAQVAYLHTAIADAEAGALAGLCTAPIHKASAKAAGFSFPGQTELLAAHLGRPGTRVVMMLAGPTLRVALCTTHLALAAVPEALTVEGIAHVLRTTALALAHDFGLRAPRLWVCGLNPHAGESGHFGDEESRLIEPALHAAREHADLRAVPGLSIKGPLVPDAAFRAAVTAPPDSRPHAVVAMYHDQGLIPLKLLDFDQAVNLTLGLRIVRTSPDHGVAHDIAGRGTARPDSQEAALRLCIELAARRQEAGG